MINLMHGAQQRDVFLAAHPFLLPAQVDLSVKPANYYQNIFDTTYQMRKKLDFTGGNAAPAKALVDAGRSDSVTVLQVRWGLHQDQVRPVGVGDCMHFSIAGVGGNPDWHCCVCTDGKRLCFMSDGAGAANMTTIKKY